MNEGTSVLLGLEDEFTVLQLERIDADTVRVVIEVIDPEGACPECGVLTSRIKERPLVRVKDLPASGQRTDLWWLKRRLVCREPACGTATFTQQSRAVPARSRLTTRLREKIGSAIASGNRAVSEVASEYQVAWSTAHRALIALANQWLPEPEPTRVLGIDETRARSVRWVLEEAGWTRSNPWMTSFVNADPTLPGHLLGLTPGRSGACVIDWLALQTPAFRAGIDLVVIDPSAPYAGGIRTALPDARIAVDKWHLVALANLMVTQVRQRITRQLHGRRGTATDKVWASRQLLLTGYEHLTVKQKGRFNAALAAEDPTNEIAAAHAVKERLRLLLAEHQPHQIRRRLYDFYDAAARADMEETSRLATTIDTWWPAVLVALTEDVTKRPHRGLQPDHQANQACRMRLHQHGQLPKAHHGPHRPHPRAETSSMKSAHAPLKCGEPFISAVNARPVFGASCHTCLPARVAAGHNSPFTCPACRLRSWALTPLHRVPPHQYRTCRWAVDASPVRTESTGPTLITAPTPPKHFNRSVTAASSRSRPRHRQVPGPLAVMSSRWRRRRGEDFAVSSTALSGIEATTESGPRCCTKPWGSIEPVAIGPWLPHHGAVTAKRCRSTADPAEPLSDAELLIGLVVSPSLSAMLGPEVTTSVRKILVQRYPGVRWQLKMAEDRLVDPPTETLDLLEAARNRVLEENWDLAVVLTEIPLKTGRRPVLTQSYPVHGVGLVSVPTLGAVHVRQKVQETTVHVVGQLLGYDAEDLNAQRDLARRAHQLSTDLDERPDDNVVQFTARVLSGNVRLLLGMIRANQPWAFVARLSRAMVVAAATGMLTLVASDLWVLAMAYGPVRLVLLAVMAIGAVSATLILGADLWERPRRRAQREQVILFNLATTATVAIGVVVFYLGLFILSWVGALLLIDEQVLAGVAGHPVNALDYAKISWLTASLATVGGALGVGLEDDDVVRAAAYTRSST